MKKKLIKWSIVVYETQRSKRGLSSGSHFFAFSNFLWVGCASLKLSDSRWETPAEKELLLPRMQE